MFRKILVPLDMTEKHGAALQMAADLARQNNGEVVLLHVIEVIQGMPIEEEKDFYGRLEEAAQEHLAPMLKALGDNGVNARKEIVFGSRAVEVLKRARDLSADLVLLTAPRFEPNNPAVSWGSLSWKVGMLAPCPVLLVK
jgi:nucleotide-binding universal stress UspA family protein